MNKYKKENKIYDALVYIIMLATLLMIAPLIYRLANDYSLNSPPVSNEGENTNERVLRNRKYTVTERQVDYSELKDTEFGALYLISAKITDNGEVIMFCESPSENNAKVGRILRIAVEYDGNINLWRTRVRSGLCDSVIKKNYVYKDYNDGTVFISNNQSAFLFDYQKLRYVNNYELPNNYNIYQVALSNNKDRLAIAAKEGFFICETIRDAPLKELITSSTPGGVLTTAREPVWSSQDNYIFYKSYAGDFVKNAGMTTDSPGGNEQLTALESTNFLFLANDEIFYYFSSGSEPYQENLFRCGYFNPFKDRRMDEKMKSQVYYFDINVSAKGTHLAALSHNGNVIKVIIIDVLTKKQIYSALYEEVDDFSFSPNEKNFIIYGKSEGEKVLNVIQIDWVEE